MASEKSWWMSRREALKILGLSGTALAASNFLPSRVFAQARKNTLVLGIDISDTITLDPARLAQYTSPMTVASAYDSLVTLVARRIHRRQAVARDQMGAHARRQGLALHACATASSSPPARRWKPKTLPGRSRA